MKILNHKLFIWRIRQFLEKIGPLGVVGLGGVAFCSMYFQSGLRPLQHEVELLRLETVSVQQNAAMVESGQTVDQLQVFYDSFPKTDAAPDILAKLHDVATAEGVALDQGEYTWGRNAEERMVRYGVVLPIKGDYVYMRHFLARVLAEIPCVSLDSVEFQRQKISETTLEARVRMTMFMVDR
jgi:Tfp pilus assembly protein PilO